MSVTVYTTAGDTVSYPTGDTWFFEDGNLTVLAPEVTSDPRADLDLGVHPAGQWKYATRTSS